MSAGDRPGGAAVGPDTPPVDTAPGSTPLDVDGVRTVFAGVIAWAVAFVVLLFFRSDLAERGETWWLWTCVAGFGLGLLGLQYCRRRRDRLRGQPPARF